MVDEVTWIKNFFSFSLEQQLMKYRSIIRQKLIDYSCGTLKRNTSSGSNTNSISTAAPFAYNKLSSLNSRIQICKYIVVILYRKHIVINDSVRNFKSPEYLFYHLGNAQGQIPS